MNKKILTVFNFCFVVATLDMRFEDLSFVLFDSLNSLITKQSIIQKRAKHMVTLSLQVNRLLQLVENKI